MCVILQNEKLSGTNNKIKYSNKFFFFVIFIFLIFYFCRETYVGLEKLHIIFYEESSFSKCENHRHYHSNKIIFLKLQQNNKLYNLFKMFF